MKPKSKDDMARCIQRLWRGHYERKFQSIGRRNKFDSGKGITLWRTFRFISIHKYDKVLGREMYLLTVLLSPDESHILIKANSREKKESEQITLKIYVKELMDYFEIDTLESTSNILKSTEKINSIKNFTSCFLDSLYIEDKTLKFNQRKKLQKLIELLNEDSVLNLDDSDVTTNKEGDPFTIQSTVELALRKNNYEQYLDTITTRVQKRVKGFLARKNFALKKDLESVKVLEMELNQDGEDLLFIVMKRLKTGELTGFCYNFSVSQYFQPTSITKPKVSSATSENTKLKRVFQKIYFELDQNAIHFHDFYLRDESMARNSGMIVPTDQLQKVDHYIQIYAAKHENEFKPRGFSMPNRYQLQGKRFLVYKGTAIIILIYTSVESKILRIDCLRQDTRQFIHSKVFHCEGEQVSVLNQGKMLYDGFKLKGSVDSNLEIVYTAPDLEEIESDIDAKKYEIICSIQRHFKSMKLKESFECSRQGENNVYHIEIYYLKVTEKIMIKVSENSKDDQVKAPTHKLYSITKPKISDMEGPELKIIQMLVLNFCDIYHPEDELTDEQVTKLINLIIFEKLSKSEKFYVDPILPQDMAKVMRAEIGAKLSSKQGWIEDIMTSDKSPPERNAYSELNRELRSELDDKDLEQSPLADSPRGDEENDTHSALMQTLRWEFDFNVNSQQQMPDEENEQISSGGSMSREGNFIKDDLHKTTRNLLKTIQPTKIEQFPVLSRHKSMRHKLLAVYKFNSIRKESKRQTSPVISANRSQDLDNKVKMSEQEPSNDKTSQQNKRRVTRHGLTLDLIVTNNDEEMEPSQRFVRGDRSRQKTLISQAGNASITSRNLELPSGPMYRSDYRIRDSPQVPKRTSKYRKSMVQVRRSRLEKDQIDTDRVDTESKVSMKSSKIKVLRKLNSAATNNSNIELTEEGVTEKRNEQVSITTPGLESVPKFFRTPEPIAEEAPEENNKRQSLFRLHTVKRVSSKSEIEEKPGSQHHTKELSVSLNQSEFRVPQLDPPLSRLQKPRRQEKKRTGLNMLPKEDQPLQNRFKRDSLDILHPSSTLQPTRMELD